MNQSISKLLGNAISEIDVEMIKIPINHFEIAFIKKFQTQKTVYL